MILSKTSASIILGVIALLCSRTMFWFLADPEGSNLLVITVMALVIYILATGVYSLLTKVTICSVTDTNKLWLIIGMQIIITSVIYLALS